MSEIEKPAPKLKLVPGLAYKGSVQVGLHWQPLWAAQVVLQKHEQAL